MWWLVYLALDLYLNLEFKYKPHSKEPNHTNMEFVLRKQGNLINLLTKSLERAQEDSLMILREHIKHKIFEIHILANNIPEKSEMFQR
jgi:hypothetical protein